MLDRGEPGKQSHAKIPPSTRKMIIAVFMVCAVVASSVQLLLLQSLKGGDDSPLPARISIAPHDPILIVGNAEFSIADAVRSGSGDPGDPYVISDWAINATDGIGIYIIGSDVDFIIRNVTINSTANDNDGIRLEGVSNAQIYNVTISSCFRGIAITNGGSNIRISQCQISDSADCGIVTQFGSTNYVEISNNEVFANGGTGIALDSTSNFNIISNDVSTNDPSSGGRRAITLVKCSLGVVTGNNIVSIYNAAFRCNTCQNMVVANNSFSCVWSYAVELLACSGFMIYHNNLAGLPPAYDNWGPENLWNMSYPVGGNYWSDYTGQDNNKDGFGDSPYVIDVNSTDYYPLNKTSVVEPIPEFPTLILPIISVLALLFAVIRRSPKKESWDL